QPLTLLLPRRDPPPGTAPPAGDAGHASGEWCGRDKIGLDVTVEVSRSEAVGEDGLSLLVLRDVSRLTMTREALRAKEAHLHMLLGQVPAIIWTTDTELSITSLVGGGLAATGLDPQEIVGMTLLEQFGRGELDSTPVSAHMAAVHGQSVRFE